MTGRSVPPRCREPVPTAVVRFLVAPGAERLDEVDATVEMSLETGEGVEAALDAVVAAVGYEPTLPFEES